MQLAQQARQQLEEEAQRLAREAAERAQQQQRFEQQAQQQAEALREAARGREREALAAVSLAELRFNDARMEFARYPLDSSFLPSFVRSTHFFKSLCTWKQPDLAHQAV